MMNAERRTQNAERSPRNIQHSAFSLPHFTRRFLVLGSWFFVLAGVAQGVASPLPDLKLQTGYDRVKGMFIARVFAAPAPPGPVLTPTSIDQVFISAFDPVNNAMRINASLTPGGTHTPNDANQVSVSVFDATNNALRVNCVLGCVTVATPAANGAVYTDAAGALFSTATGGAGTLCLVSANGGTPAWGSCAGTTSTIFSALSASTATNSIGNANFAQTWNWAITGASVKGLTIGESSASTGSSAQLFDVQTLSGSTAFPFTATAGGTANGVQMSTAGLLGPIGTGAINATQVNGASIASSLSVVATNGSGQLVQATAVPLSALAAQAADTLVMNATGGSAAPTAVAMPTSGINGCSGALNALIYNNVTHSPGCNTIATGASHYIDASTFTGATMDVQIQNAIASMPSVGSATIDATGFTGAQTWSNGGPFANVMGTAYSRCGTLLLGGANITTNQSFVIPNCWRVVGNRPQSIFSGNGPNAGGTWIQANTAANTFNPTYTTGTAISTAASGNPRTFTVTGTSTAWNARMVGSMFVMCTSTITGAACGGTAATNSAWGMITSVNVGAQTMVVVNGNTDTATSANTTLPCPCSYVIYTPLILLGDVTANVGASQVFNLNADCNDIAGCVGMANYSSQEYGYAEWIGLTGSTNIFLDVEGSKAQNSGPYENLNINAKSGAACFGGANSTIPVVFRSQGAPPRRFASTTITMNNCASQPNLAIDLEAAVQIGPDIHIEKVTYAVDISDAVTCPVVCVEPNRTATGASVYGVNTFSSGTIAAGSTQAATTTFNIGVTGPPNQVTITDSGINAGSPGWTNLLVDNNYGCTITTAGPPAETAISSYALRTVSPRRISSTSTQNGCNGGSFVNVTPAVANGGAITTDQTLMQQTLPTAFFNGIVTTIHLTGFGVYTSGAVAEGATFKVKLCTTAACTTSDTLLSWNPTSIANGGSNIPWNINADITNQTAGAAGTAKWEAHGNLNINTTTTAAAATTSFADTNTATIGTNVAASAQLFLTTTVAFGSANGSNQATERQQLLELYP